MTSFLFRVRHVTASHAEIAVFAGPDAEHRALAGAFMLRHQEARDLAAGIADALDAFNTFGGRMEWAPEAQGFDKVPPT